MAALVLAASASTLATAQARTAPSASAVRPTPEATLGQTPRAAAFPTATPSAAVTPARPSSVTLLFSGDMLWHDSLLASIRADAKALGSSQPEEFGPLLQYVAPLVRDADVAVCHTEVPFAPPGTKPSGYPSFGAPASVVRAYRELGFDYCTTASNHSRDRDFAGLTHTLDVLERDLGIVTAGTNRSAEEASPRLLTTKAGVKLAVVTGTYDINDGFDVKRPWSVDRLDDMIGRAKAARAAGADIVVAVMHAGTEYVTAPSSEQKNTATALAASGAVDLIVGHHAHTVQPIVRIGNTWVAYGLGNLLGQMRTSTPRAMEGIMLKATFVQGADGRWQVQRLATIPLLVTYHTPQGGPARIYPIKASLAAGVGPTEQLTKSLGYVRSAVGSPAGLAEE